MYAFNYEPPFRDVAGTEHSYTRTEKVARALAHLAVELLNDGHDGQYDGRFEMVRMRGAP